MSLRNNLKRIIDERGMKIKKVAEYADISVATMNNILNTEGYDTKHTNVVKLAKALNVTVDELVRD